MESKKVVKIVSEAGDSIDIPLVTEGGRKTAILVIDGIRHHLERVSRELFMSEYLIDDDPDCQPQTDSEGFCYMFVSFSK